MEDGFSYTGDWVSGEMSGKGIVVYANGDQYDGSFLNGKREGRGIMTFQDGEVIDSIWKAGKEVKKEKTKATPSN